MNIQKGTTMGSPAVQPREKKSPSSTIVGKIRGTITAMGFILNTLIHIGPLMFFAILKLIIPFRLWRRMCSIIVDSIASTWISVNNLLIRIMHNTEWNIEGVENLKKDEWYLVLANHQSWVDIAILQKIFNRKIPFLKFFLKKELIWVPLLGIAWWGLDFPFMKRYSKEFLKKKPHLKGKDMEITRKACKKFEYTHVSVMNFVEGTRFTDNKHARQQSQFNNLLKPKAGGVGFVLSAMGKQLHKILDVTITYPYGVKDFWEFLCGDIKQINVEVEQLPIGDELKGDYTNDPDFQEFFQKWINDLWIKKDKKLDQLIGNRP